MSIILEAREMLPLRERDVGAAVKTERENVHNVHSKLFPRLFYEEA